MRSDLNPLPLLPLHLHLSMLTHLLSHLLLLRLLTIMPRHRLEPSLEDRALEHFLPIVKHEAVFHGALYLFAAAGDDFGVVGADGGGEGDSLGLVG